MICLRNSAVFRLLSYTEPLLFGTVGIFFFVGQYRTWMNKSLNQDPLMKPTRIT